MKQATLDDVKYCLKNYATEGLSYIEIFCSAGISQGAKEYAELNKSKVSLYELGNSLHSGYEFCQPRRIT